MPEEIIDGGKIESVGENADRTAGDFSLANEGGLAAEQKEQQENVSEQVEGKYNEALSEMAPASDAAAHDDDVPMDAKHIGEMMDEEGKVQKLLDLASTKGVVHAVKVARSLGDYYALDRMHDELSYKLYQGLIERGLIEKE